MSDEKKVTHPGPDDPEAIHWTAGDARRTFHEKGEERLIRVRSLIANGRRRLPR
ncbi:hypothetical protein JCM18918_2117 [Cutibacterium acnes JCM 18918]|nr:hypothetical protein JCM18918_2117 [Cutibacterium acnes JCM 18918]